MIDKIKSGLEEMKKVWKSKMKCVDFNGNPIEDYYMECHINDLEKFFKWTDNISEPKFYVYQASF